MSVCSFEISHLTDSCQTFFLLLLLKCEGTCVLHADRNHRVTQLLIFNTSNQCSRAEKEEEEENHCTSRYCELSLLPHIWWQNLSQIPPVSFFFSRWNRNHSSGAFILEVTTIVITMSEYNRRGVGETCNKKEFLSCFYYFFLFTKHKRKKNIYISIC